MKIPPNHYSGDGVRKCGLSLSSSDVWVNVGTAEFIARLTSGIQVISDPFSVYFSPQKMISGIYNATLSAPCSRYKTGRQGGKEIIQLLLYLLTNLAFSLPNNPAT